MPRGRWCSRSTRTLQDDLNKSFDDYRKKELFEFRPFYAARLRAVLDAPGGPKTYEFEKVEARSRRPGTWKVTRVGGSSHNADSAAMDDLLNKLVAIKAESFVDAKHEDRPRQAGAGRERELRRGQVRARAVWHRSATTRMPARRRRGRRKIDTKSMRAAMQAFESVVIPPETDPTAADTKKPGEKK